MTKYNNKFEETLKQHKDGLIDELEQLGKHRQAQLVAWDIEQNESDYKFYFDAAWNTQQSKIDELQKRVDAALKMVSINRGFAWGPVSTSQLEQALKDNN